MDRGVHREGVPMTDRRTFSRASAVLLISCALGAASASSSCTVVHSSGSSSSSSSGSGSGGGAGGAMGTGGMGGAGPTPAETGRSLFESTVLDGLMTECGACHQLGGIADAPFLAQPDVYVAITTWPGVIVSPSNYSTLLTHPASASHGGGQAPDLSAALRAKVQAWLDYEAEHLPKPDADANVLIPPFKPFLQGAFNAIYLDPLGDDFANLSVTFNAEELPAGASKPTLLRLYNMQVHPIAGVSLHLVHPLFTIYPSGADPIPDTADSYSGFDQTYTLEGDPTFGTGELILSNWSKDARLGIAFEIYEATKTGGPVTATCKNVAKFQAEVVPQLKLWPCTTQCHGGANVQAQQQMDLSNIDAMPPDDACAQVRARITPGDPANSQILVVTDPTKQVIHLFKFAGNKNNYNSFKAAVTPWIQAEQ